LDGTLQQQGIKQATVQFSQGSDVNFAFYVGYNGAPVTSDKWDLEVIVKKNVHAQNILWKAHLHSGLYVKDGIPGFYYIILPAEATATFLPGTYFVEVRGKQKIGKGEPMKDLTVPLANYTFGIELTAGSPNPKLRPHSESEVSVDPATGITISRKTSVEPTVPDPVDTTQI
jgi:hypothetical protein